MSGSNRCVPISYSVVQHARHVQNDASAGSYGCFLDCSPLTSRHTSSSLTELNLTTRFALVFRLLTSAFGLMLLMPKTATGQYVDPGSASLLWQLLLAGVIGIAFTLRQNVVAAFRAILARVRGTKVESPAGE